MTPAPADARARRGLLVVGVIVAAGLATAVAVGVRRLDREVTGAASADAARARTVRELSFTRLSAAANVPVEGDGTVEAVVRLPPTDLWTGGGSGLTRDGLASLTTTSGLPSLRVSALASWRGQIVYALERGGWGLVTEGGELREARSGWGPLTVRALLETPGGELVVGAREGLFRSAHGSGELERLDREPCRSLALLPDGTLASGGEAGLSFVSAAGRATRVAGKDVWVDDLGFDAVSGTLWAATPLGTLLRAPGHEGDPLRPHPRGDDLVRGTLHQGRFAGLPLGREPRVAFLGVDGARSDEGTPERFRRLLSAADDLLADGPSGLFRRDPKEGWRLVRPRDPASLPRPHLNALTVRGHDLWAGFFDGGVARGHVEGDALPRFVEVPGSEAWGVNALLPSGGAIYVASLRGLTRVGDAEESAPSFRRASDSLGGAFSLARTATGVAVGYAKGVLLPGSRLLSAFHGLPGNQAYALASGGSGLWVGTPTGLGRIERSRVVSRTVPGEGRLPHPWVTALLPEADSLLVATYGGGVARRTGEGAAERWTPFAETAGLKINAAAMVRLPSGRVVLGTQSQGLWVSDERATRFTRVPSALPSPDVFSLAVFPEDDPRYLYVGTSEGLARLPLELP